MRPHGRAVEMRHVLAIKRDRAARRLDKTKDAAPDGGLAAAALADEPQRLGSAEAEGDTVHRTDLRHLMAEDAAPHRVVFRELVDLERRRLSHASPHP